MDLVEETVNPDKRAPMKYWEEVFMRLPWQFPEPPFFPTKYMLQYTQP